MTPDKDAFEKALRVVGDGDVAFILVVKPGQKREGLSIGDDGGMVLRINAPAQEGRANDRVVEFLAEVFGRAKRDIIVARGHLSRHKEIRIKNANPSGLIKTLQAFVRARGEHK